MLYKRHLRYGRRQLSWENCCRGLMKLNIVHRSVFAVPVLSVLVVLVLAVLVRAGFFNLAELQGYDLLVFAGGAAPANENIAIVDFDNASVEAIGKYPIPRKTLARVLGRIAEGQPAVIGLDKLLSDTSDEKSDVELALALAEARIVVLPEVFATDQMPADQPAGFVSQGRPADGLRQFDRGCGWIYPADVRVHKNAVGFGVVVSCGNCQPVSGPATYAGGGGGVPARGFDDSSGWHGPRDGAAGGLDPAAGEIGGVCGAIAFERIRRERVSRQDCVGGREQHGGKGSLRHAAVSLSKAGRGPGCSFLAWKFTRWR